MVTVAGIGHTWSAWPGRPGRRGDGDLGRGFGAVSAGYPRVRASAAVAAELDGAGPDEVLMTRVGQGDRPAFQVLVQRHLQRSLDLARRMTANASDAEEVAQEAFLRVWTTASRWRPEGAAFRTWLYRIVVNLCLDRARRKPFAPLEDAGDPHDPSPDALARLERAETKRRVGEAIGRLPERQRAALVLSYFDGLSNAEAAQVLGVSVSGLEALLVRARRALRGRLADENRAGDPGDVRGGAS
ncbi:MAG: RNA polymerase sigma factor [Alphaproteobacteria bacterium]|nr:RNA polymerase sigma factor [Alphaproteobacteria bacterium]